ncbi:putative U6 snRNA-associated Sm-like protein LSm1 [Glarea lozoyensis 74030]|uniref:Putative U6 snRNA-associated Sm-like protein LSm1 n=1 Tax=Glarea lozoyensis (strain ATCC 74030 / MF5533) TaxID=1104152 RepID=H0EMG5_GLAL7|nr:putative U6 snRNA-associated Sm-like protein LSm1 [Glarea lozoyensis 74030]
MDAAQREAWEEAGISCKIDYDLGTIEETRTPKQMSKDAPKALYQFFEVTVTTEHEEWPEKHKRNRQWATFKEAESALNGRPDDHPDDTEAEGGAMEHLTLNDEVAAMGGGPQQQQQLPPQMFTTAAQLLDLTDTNLVLQSTIERIFIPPTPSTPGYYADFPRGIFLVRGENVLLLGEIDLDKDDDVPEGYERGEPGMVQRLDKERKGREARRERVVKKRLAEEGFEGEGLGEALL